MNTWKLDYCLSISLMYDFCLSLSGSDSKPAPKPPPNKNKNINRRVEDEDNSLFGQAMQRLGNRAQERAKKSNTKDANAKDANTSKKPAKDPPMKRPGNERVRRPSGHERMKVKGHVSPSGDLSRKVAMRRPRDGKESGGGKKPETTPHRTVSR